MQAKKVHIDGGRFEDLRDRLRLLWDGLNDRERKLVGLMGAVSAALLVLMPVVLMLMANRDVASRNAELRDVLAELARRRPELEAQAAQRRAAEQRYEQQAPPLGSFVESEARKQGLTLREVTDQPEQTLDDFVRRNVRVGLPGVQLTPVMNLLAAIDNSRYPVAIEHLVIEHYQKGDKFNVKLGVVTYDKKRRATARHSSKLAAGKTGQATP